MKNKITIIDTYNNPYSYEDVKDYCADNDVDAPEENSNKDYEIRQHLLNWDIEDFTERIKYSKEETPCIVSGNLGLWDGRHTIEPKAFNSLYDAICACFSNCDYYIIEQYHSTLKARGIHHDGSNYFTINLLNKKGYYAWKEGREVDLTRRVYHKTLTDCIW